METLDVAGFEFKLFLPPCSDKHTPNEWCTLLVPTPIDFHPSLSHIAHEISFTNTISILCWVFFGSLYLMCANSELYGTGEKNWIYEEQEKARNLGSKEGK